VASFQGVDVVEGGKVCVCVTLKKSFHTKMEVPKYTLYLPGVVMHVHIRRNRTRPYTCLAPGRVARYVHVR
jgi:hypothetical protein